MQFMPNESSSGSHFGQILPGEGFVLNRGVNVQDIAHRAQPPNDDRAYS